MAYDASQDQSQDDETKNQATQPATQASPSLSGGGGGFAGGGAQGASGAPGTFDQKPTSSGNWTNVQSYLDANSGQGQGIDQSLATTVGNQAQQATNDLSQVQQGFQDQAPYQTLNNTTGSQVDQAFSNPSQYAAPGADTSQAETYLNGPVSGWGLTPTIGDIQQYAPTSGPTWNSVGSEFNTAQNALQATQSESGRDTLLQDQYSGNGMGYNQGEQGFDQLLLQQGGNQALQGAYNQYAPSVLPASGQTLSAAQQAALTNSQTYATNEANQATAYQTQATNDLNNQISGLGSNLTGEVASDQASFLNPYTQLTDAIAAHNVTSEQAGYLGLAPTTQIYTVDPSTYVHANANPYSGPEADNYAASNQDWQNYAGLNALVNGPIAMSNNGTQAANLQAIGLTGTQAEQANAPVITPYTVDTGGLQGQINNAQAAYQNALSQYVPGNAPNPTYSTFGPEMSTPQMTYAQAQQYVQANQGNPDDAAPVQYFQGLLNQLDRTYGVGNTLSNELPGGTGNSTFGQPLSTTPSASAPAPAPGSTAPVPRSPNQHIRTAAPVAAHVQQSYFPSLMASVASQVSDGSLVPRTGRHLI